MLAAGALAVMLSYMVQANLSKRLKYKSLYESQVLARTDSPVHYDEAVESAIMILNQKKILGFSNHAHLDLDALLSSGIPVDLGNNKQLMIRTVKACSYMDGKPVFNCCDETDTEGGEIIGVIRNHRLLLPANDIVVQESDRVFAIVPQNTRDSFRHSFIEATE